MDSNASKESRKAQIPLLLYFRPGSLIPSTLGNHTWTESFGCKPNKKLLVLLSRNLPGARIFLFSCKHYLRLYNYNDVTK